MQQGLWNHSGIRVQPVSRPMQSAASTTTTSLWETTLWARIRQGFFLHHVKAQEDPYVATNSSLTNLLMKKEISTMEISTNQKRQRAQSRPYDPIKKCRLWPTLSTSQATLKQVLLLYRFTSTLRLLQPNKYNLSMASAREAHHHVCLSEPSTSQARNWWLGLLTLWLGTSTKPEKS